MRKLLGFEEKVASRPASSLALIERAQQDQASTLNLSYLGLIELSATIGRLTQLNELALFGNEITQFPELICQLSQLEYLYLHLNRLNEVPEAIGRLTQLRTLYLSGNRLERLPEAIGQLSNLEVLSVSHNQLKELPDSIGKLQKLVRLYLNDNQLRTLPDSLGDLSRLETLYLANNRLVTLPESLRKLVALRELFLHGNRELSLPPGVLGPTSQQVAADQAQPSKPRSIFDYYVGLRRTGQRPLNEAKLILLGRGAVGKTSLVNRLVNNIFRAEQQTEGIAITEWKLRLNIERVRLNIWDFGGQEIMHATHQFFLTQRSLYLLVLNGREGGEDADAEYWLKLIDGFGNESPVIVVLNKISERPFDVNRRALRHKYPFIRDFIKTDCKTRVGIDELLRVIQRETDQLEHLRDAFPKSWFVIKDRLAAMGKNYLSFDEFRWECSDLGEPSKSAQETLAFYLHSLGIALNYKDDPRLQDTHVLNPRWVTNGIYRILNSELLERQKGEIHLEDLSEILDPNEYPRGMQHFILDLMKKFELCFSFPEDDARYLIPELLDKQEPPEAADFDANACLNFQYHYMVLPEGLLPRFIVRTHALSRTLPRWRTGVIMEFEGCRALVKADVQERKVFISVLGPAPNRRRLLAVIRSDFERIHHDIKNLRPDEMVPVPGRPELIVDYKKLQVREQGGETRFTEVADGEIVELDVQSLLNGIDLEETRSREQTMDLLRRPMRLFCSYSHKDESMRNELDTHLKLLQRRGSIESWHDRKVGAGDDWAKEIDKNLERADIVLLLVSADFIASDYCYEREMNRAMERHDKKEARVIPVIVRDVNWSKAPFAKLQSLPRDGLAVTKWPDRDSAWRTVSEGIEALVNEMQESSS